MNFALSLPSALVALALLFSGSLAQAAEFKPLVAFERLSVAVPAGWPCGPGEEGAVVCREPKGLATLSIQLLQSRYEKPLSPEQGRKAAAQAAKLLAAGEAERFGSPYEGWETQDGGALEGGRTGQRDGHPVRIFDWTLFVAQPEGLSRATFQLVAREEFFDAAEGADLAAKLGESILQAKLR